MKIVVKKLEELTPNEKNVRLHTETQRKEYIRSLKMFGQIKPAIIDENNVILCGNGMYEAMKEMGLDTIEVYQYTNLTENQKIKLMIADNKIFTLGFDNLDTINQLLDELTDDLDVPGYDEEVLKSMLADAEEITEQISSYGTLDTEQIASMKERAEEPKQTISGFNQPATQPEGSYETTDERINGAAQAAPQMQEGSSTEVRRSVICPKCGETIWL